jgi:hypothetical protein
MDSETDVDPTFDLAAMLVSSARGAHEEGVLTASLRLLDAAGRLAGLTTPPSPRTVAFLDQLQQKSKEAMTGPYLASEGEFIAFLDSLVVWVADEIRVRRGLTTDLP